MLRTLPGERILEIMKLIVLIFALLLVHDIWKDIHQVEQPSLIPGAEAWRGKLGGIFKKIRDRLKKTSTSNKEKVDQAIDNIDRAKEVAEKKHRERERERKEHERRRAREKAERDERRMNRLNGSDRRDRQRNSNRRDRSREKADRDRERMDRMDRGRK